MFKTNKTHPKPVENPRDFQGSSGMYSEVGIKWTRMNLTSFDENITHRGGMMPPNKMRSKFQEKIKPVENPRDFQGSSGMHSEVEIK